MGTVILSTLISLDGRINGTDGGIDSHVVGFEVHQYFNDQVRTVDTLLDGLRMTKEWPPSGRPPTTTPRARRRWSGTRNSRVRCPSSSSPARPSTRGGTPRSLRETASPTAWPSCERGPGTRHLLYGGAKLAATFMRLDFIDEYWPFINPVALGGGTPLFGELKMPLERSLVEVRAFHDAVVLVCYTRP
jgi:RibD C-terminal domain